MDQQNRVLCHIAGVGRECRQDRHTCGGGGFHIAGLMNGIFGTAKFMDAQCRGDQSRSAGKVEASRANGAKGGRPRKIS